MTSSLGSALTLLSKMESEGEFLSNHKWTHQEEDDLIDLYEAHPELYNNEAKGTRLKLFACVCTLNSRKLWETASQVSAVQPIIAQSHVSTIDIAKYAYVSKQ